MKYLALTIGPITKTIQKAKNTQSLWGASYLFSYLMREIVLNLKDNYSDNFVIPYIKNNRIFSDQSGAGLFPDRMIIIDGKIEDLKSAINGAIDKLVNENGVIAAINSEIKEYNELYKKNISTTNAEEFKDYLYMYLQLGAVSLAVKDGENVIEKCENALSTLELQQSYYSQEKTDLLYYFIQNISDTKLMSGAFNEENYRFPSILEIATAEFKLKYPDNYNDVIKGLLKETGKKFKKIRKGEIIEDDEDKLIKTLKEQVLQKEDTFRRYHKYLAIVKADGDNMGKAVTAIYTEASNKVEDIDKAILRFNLEAVGQIVDYGGEPIYLGGDDLLFFAPVCAKNRNIFDLVRNLSETYNSKIKDVFDSLNIQPKKIPTLSFGISISYYKYPMNEALKVADDLLNEAKSGDKNAVSFRVMKHSGQFFGMRFAQDKDYFINGFKALIQNTKLDNEDAFLSSIMYRMREMEYILKPILEADKGQVRLENFFDNNFNEGIHQFKKNFLIDVADFTWQTYNDTQGNFDLTLKTVYSTLRFIQFIHQKDTENND